LFSQNKIENNRHTTTKEQKHQNMKLRAFISTVLVATHVVAVDNDIVATPAHTPKLKKCKTSEVRAHKETTQSTMVHLPAESRIIGGNNAANGAYLFFVQGDGCSGSLMTDDIVLTDTHCAGAFDGKVYVGLNQQYSTVGSAERIPVQNQVAHPSYNFNTEAYDLMLLKAREARLESKLEACHFEQKRQQPRTQRRSDYDRRWCHVRRRERLEPVEARERRLDCLQHL
jgi:hypothetical protein